MDKMATGDARFRLTVSQANMVTFRQQTKGGGNVPVDTSAAGQVYNKRVEFGNLGGSNCDKLERTMVVMATGDARFRLAALQANTITIRPQTKDGGNVPVGTSAAGQVHNQTVEFGHLGASNCDIGDTSCEPKRRI